MPETPRGRADTRMFVTSLDALAAVLQAEGGPATYNRRAVKRMEEVFADVDRRLKTSHAPWLDGERPGHCDISFLPLLSALESMETSFPITLEALTAYWQRATMYEPFQKTNHRSAPMEGRRCATTPSRARALGASRKRRFAPGRPSPTRTSTAGAFASPMATRGARTRSRPLVRRGWSWATRSPPASGCTPRGGCRRSSG